MHLASVLPFSHSACSTAIAALCSRFFQALPTLHLYHRPRIFGRRTLYLGSQQGKPSHAITLHRFHRPRISIHDYLDKKQKLATIERLTFQQARVWTSVSMRQWTGHLPIITCRHPPSSIWGFTVNDVSDVLNPRFHTDIYEWRPAHLVGEVPRQLGIMIGWALLRKERLEYQHRAESPVNVVERKEEVVAVAGVTPLPTRSMPKGQIRSSNLESKRLLTLRFLENGRDTEGMSEDWEVCAAVITWLGLWHRI